MNKKSAKIAETLNLNNVNERLQTTRTYRGERFARKASGYRDRKEAELVFTPLIGNTS